MTFKKAAAKNISRLALINQRKKYAEIKLFKVGKRKYSAIIQCKAHKANSSANTFTAGKKRNKQLNRIEQGLFWNYATWNWRYVQVLLIDPFPRLLHAVVAYFEPWKRWQSKPVTWNKKTVAKAKYYKYYNITSRIQFHGAVWGKKSEKHHKNKLFVRHVPTMQKVPTNSIYTLNLNNCLLLDISDISKRI